MPGVVSLRETSETQSKPSYCRGQGWGALGMLVGSLEAYFCLPFQVQLQHGFRHRGESAASGKRVPLRLAERVVELALAFAIAHDRPSGVVLEACFAVASVFRLARSVDSVVRRQPDVQLVGRAKKNYVASCPAAPKARQRCGPQPRYGDKIVLWEGFDQPPLCEEVTAQVYGKTETVRLLATPLLWTPLGDGVWFIGAITSRGPLVLLRSALTLAPLTALQLYCGRSRIEIMFAMLKQLIGAFRLRFWSQKLLRHACHPTATRHLKAPLPRHLPTVQGCWQAYETFVLCAAIALGLLPLIALRFGAVVWQQHTL